jgi:WD40-like Beta Propeller Repeat
MTSDTAASGRDSPSIDMATERERIDGAENEPNEAPMTTSSAPVCVGAGALRSHRAFRASIGALGLTLLLAAAPFAAARQQRAQPKILARVHGAVLAVAQGRRQIAWIRSSGSPVQVLSLGSGRLVTVGSSRRGCTYCFRLDAIAVSDRGRVHWQEVTSGGNTYLVVSLLAPAPGSSRSRIVAGTDLDVSSDPDGVPLQHFEPRGLPMAADGTATLFYAGCDDGDLCSRLKPGIYRVGGLRPRRLASATRPPAALALNGRRFAVVTNSLRCCNFLPAWSRDGKRIAWIYHGNLWTIGAEGTGDRQLAAGVLPPFLESDGATEDLRPSWSPDGTSIAFERLGFGRHGGLLSRGIYRVSATGGAVRRLGAGSAPTWAPDGTKIAFVRGKDVYTIAPDGSGPRRLTPTSRATLAPLSWSPDSTRIAVSRGGDIYVLRSDGTGETRLTTTRRAEAEPAWSPDGTRIAYVDGSGVVVGNADGSGARHVTTGGDRHPVWSPDSSRLAFVRGDGVFVVNAGGGGLRRLITGYRSSPQWAPGSAIVVGDVAESGEYPSRPGIRILSPSGTEKKVAPISRFRVEVRNVVTGSLIKHFVIGGQASAGALGPGYIVLLVAHEPQKRIELFNQNGSLRNAVAVPASVRNVSAAGNAVVFATGRVIRRLDARTGAVTELATTGRAPVGLTIEGRRVVWAENGRGGARIRALVLP